MSKRTDGGQYLASVSIRNGRGSTCHDRVFRFIPLFASHAIALQYAMREGCRMASAKHA